MMRPVDLVRAALVRLEHAPTLIGPLEVVGLTELAPCPLLLGLTTRVPVRWIAGPRSVPSWKDQPHRRLAHGLRRVSNLDRRSDRGRG